MPLLKSVAAGALRMPPLKSVAAGTSLPVNCAINAAFDSSDPCWRVSGLSAEADRPPLITGTRPRTCPCACTLTGCMFAMSDPMID